MISFGSTRLTAARGRFATLVAATVASAGSIASAQVNTHLPLNYNFHGMAHSAAITGGADEWTDPLVVLNADGVPATGYRSISDRGLVFDAANAHSIAAYSGQPLGATGMSYAFFDTLGYGNTTYAGPQTAAIQGLDMVHMGSRCAGFPPATIFAYDATLGNAVGAAPEWSVCDQLGTNSGNSPTTVLSSPIQFDANTEIGLLYHDNGAGQFNVTLGFSDTPGGAITLTLPVITLRCVDWFGLQSDPAIVANMPVTFQRRLQHVEVATTFHTFQGVQNNERVSLGAWSASNAGPNLNVVEAVISTPLITGGAGTYPATPAVVGKYLQSISFSALSGTLTYPASGGRGFAMYAATARTGIPNQANADCATPTVVTTAANIANVATNNVLSGSSPAAVTADDTSAVWFSFTPTASVPVLVSTCTTSIDTTLAVYTSCAGSPFISNDDTAGCGTGGSRVIFPGVMNQTYLIRVAGKAGRKGNFTLHVEDFPTPGNGSCATATPAMAGTGPAGDNAGTTLRANDFTTSSCGGGADNTGVWYTYVAPANRTIEARTCLDGDPAINSQVRGVTGVTTISGTNSTIVLPLDTTMAVYTGTCGSLTEVASGCNDNGCSVSSRVRWEATMGTLYYIRVAGKAGAGAAFTLHVDDPVHTDLTMPIQFNWNGICHGTTTSGPLISEQTVPDGVGLGSTNENRCDLNGFRAIADRGLLFDPNGTATNALNFGGTIGYQGIVYQVYNTAMQADMVHLGNRNLAAGGIRSWNTTANCPATQITPDIRNNGRMPLWLNNDDQTTVPQVSSMTGLNAVFGANTRIGILYHISNVDILSGTTPREATFDVTLTFADTTAVIVRVVGSDWFGGASTVPYNQVLPLPVVGSGVEVQRVLGIYRGVQNTDRGSDAATGPLKVNEAIISTASLIAGGFDPTIHGALTSIAFGNLRSGNIAQDGIYSAVGIYAATLRDPASFNLNFGPSGVGTVVPNQLVVGASGRMTVTVSRGSGSPNNITSVSVNGTSIGLGTITLNDSGVNGDLTPNDNVWSRSLGFPINATPGAVSLPFTVTDAQARTANGPVIFTLTPPSGSVTPNPVLAGATAKATVTLSPTTGGSADISTVTVNGASIGVGGLNLNDSGANGDLVINDGIWSADFVIPANAQGQTAMLPFTVTDVSARSAMGTLTFDIVGPPASATDLGTLTTGLTSATYAQTAGLVTWFKFTLANPLGVDDFLDIDTEGTLWDGTNDTHIALYSDVGALIGTADDDDGSGFLSQLTYGNSTVPRPAVGGVAYNGRDGTLAAGTYYLAVTGFTGTFGANWTVTTTSTQTGSTQVRLLSGTVPAGGTPTEFVELGTLTTTLTSTQALSAGGVVWFRVVIPEINGANPTRTYLDIDTEGSAIADTVVGFFRDDGSGTLVATDDNDGSGTLSQFSYGRGGRPAVGDGLAYNGRDGVTLAAGTYYIAVTEATATFGNNFVVFFNTGASAGNVTLNLRTGMQSIIIHGPVNNPANNHDYYLLDQGLTWTDAEAFAVGLNGHLASMDDLNENEWVRTNVLRHDSADRRGWIGLNDTSLSAGQGNQTWAWTDGTTVTFFNWSDGEPNNANDNEHYVEMLGDGLWNDMPVVGAAGGNPGSFALVEVGATTGACCCGSSCSITTAGACAGSNQSFAGTGTSCTPYSATAPCCRGDYNKTGAPATVQDIFDFLSGYFGGNSCADSNDSGGLPTVQDIFDYLSAYFGGGC